MPPRNLANRQSLWLLFAALPISLLIAWGLFQFSSRSAAQAANAAHAARAAATAASIRANAALIERMAGDLRLAQATAPVAAVDTLRSALVASGPHVAAITTGDTPPSPGCADGCWDAGAPAQEPGVQTLRYRLPAAASGSTIAFEVKPEMLLQALRRHSDHEIRMFVMDPRAATVLAHTWDAFDGKPLNDAFIAEFRRNTRSFSLGDAQGDAQAAFTVWSPVRQQLVDYYLARLPGMPWLVVASVPHYRSRALVSRLALVHFGSVAGGMALLVLLMRYYLTHSLRPLNALATAAGRIAEGDFDFSLPQPTSHDEIGRLGKAFASMRDRLQDTLLVLQNSTAARERDQSAMEIAREIQRAMLPSSAAVLRDVTSVDVAEFLMPQRDVGGDFYTFFLLGGRRLFFMIGDVADKGVAAALLMARTTTLAQALAPHTQRPDDLLAALNDELVRGNSACMFVTAICGLLDTGTGKLMIASAGHDPAICLTPPSYPDWLLPDDNGPALGLFADAHYPCTEVQLLAGQILLMYTDGITEAQNAAGEQFGEHSLMRSLTQAPISSAEDVILTTVSAVREHAGDAQQSDDISLLCVRWMPPEQIQALDILNRMSDVFLALNWLEDTAENLGMPIHETMLLRVAAEELLVNSVNYGYPDGRLGRIHLTLIRQPPLMTLRIVDNANPFDPTTVAAGNADSDADRSLGGEGLHLAQSLSQGMRYYRKRDGNMLEVDFALPDEESITQ